MYLFCNRQLDKHIHFYTYKVKTIKTTSVCNKKISKLRWIECRKIITDNEPVKTETET